MQERTLTGQFGKKIDLTAPYVEGPMVVEITREPFMPEFRLKLPNGSTEELEPDDTRAWFKRHGANMDIVEKALDYCWNFYRATIRIKNPQKSRVSALEPMV